MTEASSLAAHGVLSGGPGMRLPDFFADDTASFFHAGLRWVLGELDSLAAGDDSASSPAASIGSLSSPASRRAYMCVKPECALSVWSTWVRVRVRVRVQG